MQGSEWSGPWLIVASFNKTLSCSMAFGPNFRTLWFLLVVCSEKDRPGLSVCGTWTVKQFSPSALLCRLEVLKNQMKPVLFTQAFVIVLLMLIFIFV